jgi:hypothetical protein
MGAISEGGSEKEHSQAMALLRFDAAPADRLRTRALPSHLECVLEPSLLRP